MIRNPGLSHLPAPLLMLSILMLAVPSSLQATAPSLLPARTYDAEAEQLYGSPQPTSMATAPPISSSHCRTIPEPLT
jgi:hypothetical protein